VESYCLAVDIGEGDDVTIDEVDVPYSRTGQRLCQMPTYAANSENSYRCRLQTEKAVFPDEGGGTGMLGGNTVVHSSLLRTNGKSGYT
jgi:hypothetical protein